MSVGRGTITITGGSGFLGRMLQSGLRKQGYRIDVFDRLRGPVIGLLRSRFLGTSKAKTSQRIAEKLHRRLRSIEASLIGGGLIRPTTDDILALRSELAERFKGSYAVIHLAALPHPHFPGAVAADFQRINFDGAVNVFEAARDAGVAKFIFASSGQVYGINKPVRIDQFPILETNYTPTLEDGQSAYGHLKRAFEIYLERESKVQDRMQSVAFRLEFPGVRSNFAWNLYISTSIENTVAGFAAALARDLDTAFEAFNLADDRVDEKIVDIQQFIRQHWPEVKNRTRGNQCLLGTEKASALLGYRPLRGGTYYALPVMW